MLQGRYLVTGRKIQANLSNSGDGPLLQWPSSACSRFVKAFNAVERPFKATGRSFFLRHFDAGGNVSDRCKKIGYVEDLHLLSGIRASPNGVSIEAGISSRLAHRR